MSDLINRQAAVEAAVEYLVEYCGGAFDEEMQNGLKKTLDVLPSAEQERTGKWIATGYDGYADGYPVYDEWQCSACGWELEGDEPPTFKYCPKCGARME